jgi:uncharacterized protein (DUF58 family)
MPVISKYLDPSRLAHLGNLDLIARLVVEGYLRGLHRSPYRGFSVEFAEHRAYTPGDDPRYVDWRATARTDRLLVKEFEEETNLRAVLVLDASASMGFAGEADVPKLEYAVYLAASLGLLLLRQRDAVGLAVAREGLAAYIPPRSSRRHLPALLAHLVNLQPRAGTDFAATLLALSHRLRRRALYIVLSDLYQQPQQIINALAALRGQKHECLVFHLVNPLEKELPHRGELILQDMESNERITVVPGITRKGYERRFADYQKELREGCLKHRIDYEMITTDTLLEDALGRYLIKRARLG